MKSKQSKSLYTGIFSSSVSVVISLSLVLFFIGVLALLIINTQKLSNYIKENVGFTIMLKDEISEIQLLETQKILDASSFVKEMQFVSKKEATKNLQTELGEDFVQFLGYSPLLASIDIKLNANYANIDSLTNIKEKLQDDINIHEIYYQEDLIKKINANVNKVSLFLFAFCSLLFIISFVLINNTIRLSIYAKRFTIKTMRLVGATNFFIQKPFIITGIYQGLYSSIFAIFMIIGSIQLIHNETASMLNITDLKIIAMVFILIFVSGIFISWISTYFAVRKYIKLNESELHK